MVTSPDIEMNGMRHTAHHRKSHAYNLASGAAPRTVSERKYVSFNTTPAENDMRLRGKDLSARRMPMSGDVELLLQLWLGDEK